MPQMMPLNWLMLMLFFTLLFIIFMKLFYFNKNFIMIPNLKISSLSSFSMNWSW
uniref:ATP synthase F0 subunit 8 n=1 Tax=Hydropsyche rhomboana TaxID=761877 RepID=UPI002236FF22|nr:ATP synthase F0 subunit 8 [Hydropsyche rhomboana]UYO79308.1 ATP synthase F0 subunit 8 [Hydropsyche rhomboana]